MKRVILIGFMGSGKSTLGKKIASRLNVPFIDSDKEIETHFNKTIGEIFVENGESHFREIESNFISSLIDKEKFVLATGGGMPCFGKNMDELNDLGITFYLERSPKELANRLIQAKEHRPLIDGMEYEELVSFIENKLGQREEFYKKAAFVLNREEQTPEAIANIMTLLQPEALQKN